jgi:hypothetical protein
MTFSILLAAFQYHPRVNDHYRVYEDAWFACWNKWGHMIDKVYLIDQDYEFDPQKYGSKFEIIKTETLPDPVHHHWDSFRQVIPRIKEDWIMMMDNDTLFYDKEEMSLLLDAAKTTGNDVFTTFDGSGGVSIFEKYPIMAPNENRGERKRFAPLLCLIRRELINKTSCNFTPHRPGKKDFRDSFGKWTEEVLDLKPKIVELEDDRNTLRLKEDGTITKDTWLDGPEYKWSTPIDKEKRLGYYHIRNFNHAIHAVNSFHVDKSSYELHVKTAPFSETMRSMAWLWIFTRMFKPQFLSRIKPVLKDLGGEEYWEDYIVEFKKYHSWLEEF